MFCFKKLTIAGVAAIVFGVTFLKAQVPEITSFIPESGTIESEVTILGSNFDPTPSNNIVYFGGVRAEVTASSNSELTVVVPVGASRQPISVLVNGLIGYAQKPFALTFDSDGTIADSPGTFDSAITIDAESGSEPYFTKFGDMNGDGAIDMIAGNQGSDDYFVYINSTGSSANISFQDPENFDISSAAYEAVLADFDGDGKLDIAMVSEDAIGSAFLKVDKNMSADGGTASFTNKVSTTLNSLSESITAADLNGDGKTDIVVVDSENNEISVFENSSSSGVISFADPVNFTVGNGPLVVITENVNQDALVDVIALNSSDNSISILKNTSSGGLISFEAKVDVSISSSSQSIWAAMGDLNDDGLSDIVVRNISSVSVIENQSSSEISFGSPVETPTDAGGGIISLDDFNGDAKPDVLISGFNTIGIFKNTSIGMDISFASLAEFGLPSLHGPTVIESADLDGNGEPDMISLSNIFFFDTYHFDILRNKHSGTDFGSFSFDVQTSDATINADSHTIDIDVSVQANTSALISSFTLSPGAEASIGGLEQVSGTTSNDFSSPVVYTIMAEDEATQDWIVNVHPSGCLPESNIVDESACDSFEFDGITLTKPGQYFATFTNTLGCDSLVTLNLTFLEEERSENVYTSDSEYEFDGDIYTESGQYLYSYTNQAGCDSLVFLNLTFLPGDDDPFTYFDLLMPEGTPQLNADFANLGGTIETGDLDGDGDADVIVSGITNNTGEFSFSVAFETLLYRNDGTGNFLSDPELLEEKSALIEIADFDQDNDLDLIIAGFTSSTEFSTSILLNDGIGNFEKLTTHGIDNFRAGSLRVIDLDMQNGPDIILMGIVPVGSEDVYSAKIYYNQGNAEFIEYDESVLTGLWGGNSDAGDIDNDGDLDIIMTGRNESNEPQLFTYYNNEGVYQDTGTSGLSLPSTDGRELVHMIDVNHDDVPDVIIGKYFFLNDGTGAFELQSVGLADDIERPWAIAEDDINDDGWADLVVSGTTSAGISSDPITHILFGDALGNMNFSQEVEGILGGGAALIDINGDSKLDLLTSGYANSEFQAEVETFINDGMGFMNKNVLEAIDQEFSDGDAHFYDFDNDGDLDLIIGGSNEENDAITTIYWNDGVGNFTLDTGNEFAETKYNVILDDFNGDDHIDVVTTHANGNRLYLGDGLGGFAEKEDANLGSNAEPYATSADLDGDDDQDLVIIGSTNTRIAINNGSGVFTDMNDIPLINMYSSRVDIADADGDLDLDLFVIGDPRTSGMPNQANIYLNDGNGNFTLDGENDFTGLRNPLANFADVDGDGDMDIFTSGDTGSQQISFIYLNDGEGYYTLDDSNDISGAYLGDSEFSDLDGDGDQDLVLTGHNRVDRTNHSMIYFNNGWGHFREYTDTRLVKVNHSLLAIGDANGDGTQDILISGADNGKQTRIYRNGICSDEAISLVVEQCENYVFFDQEISESGQYSFVENKSCGRSITTTLNLTILSDDVTEEIITCDEFEFNGELLTSSGAFTATFTNKVGCDSLVNLNLTILESTSSLEITEQCESYEWNDETFDVSGFYERQFTNAVGCDSLAMLELTILEKSEGESDILSCDIFEWEGSLYNESGVYQTLLTNSVGCDSLATLNLEIVESDVVVVEESACGSYFFNGEDKTESGIFAGLFTNTAGCDSIVDLELTIYEEPSAEVEVNGMVLFAENQSGVEYQWFDCSTDEALEGEDKRQLTPPRSGFYAVEVSNENCTVISECLSAEIVLSLDEQVDNAISLYPNPTQDIAVIQLTQNIEVSSLALMSISGQQIPINYGDIGINQIMIDLTELSKGVYIIRLESEAGEEYLGRIIKN